MAHALLPTPQHVATMSYPIHPYVRMMRDCYAWLGRVVWKGVKKLRR